MTLYRPLATRTWDGDQDAGKGLSLLDLKYAQPSARVPLYQRLRQHGLVYDERSKCWLCAHGSGLTSILGDGRFASGRPSGSGTAPTSPGKAWREHSAPGSALREMKASVEQVLARQLLVKDGADHTRVQGIMNPVLRQMGHDMSTSIGQRVEALLDAVAPTRQWDVMQQLVLPLVLRSMVQLLLGEKDPDSNSLHRFQAWSHALASVTSGCFSRDDMQQVLLMREAFYLLLAHKRCAPGHDLFSIFAADARWQNDDELVANAMMLLAAGSVTTTKAVTHSLWFLLQHVHVREYLRAVLLQYADPHSQAHLLKPVVERLLCRVTPTRYIVRWATQDIAIEGKLIRSGQQVFLFLEGANDGLLQQEALSDTVTSDAAVQEQYHLLRRMPTPHFTFGSSSSQHYCPGAPLARMILQHTLLAVLLRFPHLRLAPVPQQQWGKNTNLGGLVALPVVHTPERGA